MTQADERLPLQTTDTAAQYLFQEIRKFTNLLPGRDDEAAKRFLTIAMQVLSQKPDLLRKCGRVSVLNCLIECARLRLDPEGALGHAYLIPYKNVCTVQIGYKGFCQLVYRQDIQKVWTAPVYPEDDFQIVLGDNPSLHHVPEINNLDRESELDALLGCYACVKLPSGEIDFEWMNLTAIKKTRGKSSAWTDWPIEMAKIRPLKRLLKRQRTTEKTLANGMALDDRDGTPRNPKLETEPEVIEVKQGERPRFGDEGYRPQPSDSSSSGSTLVKDWYTQDLKPPEKTGKDLIPAAVEKEATRIAKMPPEESKAESRKDINARIEKSWYDFHKAKIPDDCLEMDRELKDYLDPDKTGDAEAWKFADLLARALLVAGAQAR